MKAANAYITYPGGLSLSAVSAHNRAHPMTTEDFFISFKLEVPIPGT